MLARISDAMRARSDPSVPLKLAIIACLTSVTIFDGRLVLFAICTAK